MTFVNKIKGAVAHWLMEIDQTESEELGNAVTHGLGAVLSTVGLIHLILLPEALADPVRLFAYGIFGVALVLLYTASVLYHREKDPQKKEALNVLDNALIFLLIAGTYTPITLISLQGAVGQGLFLVTWMLAISGIVFKLLFPDRFRLLSTILYLALGWSFLPVAGPIVKSVPGDAMNLILLGGLFYSGGILFYLIHRIPFNHTIWHLFVMAGSASHFFAIYFYI